MKNVETTISSKIPCCSLEELKSQQHVEDKTVGTFTIVAAEVVIRNRYAIVTTDVLVEYIIKLNTTTEPLRTKLLLGPMYVSHDFHYVDGVLYDAGLEDDEHEWTLDTFTSHYSDATWAVLPLDVSRQLNGEPSTLDIDGIKNYYHQYLLFTGSRAEDVVLGAGAACVIHGVRDFTSDLDVMLPDAPYLEYLNQDVRLPLHLCNGTLVISWDEYIDLHPSVDIDYDDVVFVDGVCVLSPDAVLRQKLQMNRPKDQTDIVRLKELCGSSVDNICSSKPYTMENGGKFTGAEKRTLGLSSQTSLTSVLKSVMTVEDGDGVDFTELDDTPDARNKTAEHNPKQGLTNILKFVKKSKIGDSSDGELTVLEYLNNAVSDYNATKSTVVGFTLIAVCEDSTLFSTVGTDGRRSVLSRLIGETEILKSTLTDSFK
jgi:hypothetical protein